MKRVVALDIGTVRIGVAVSDPSGTFAQALDVWRADGPWLGELGETLGRFDAGLLLVGMPRRTDGTDGPEASGMRLKIKKIADRYPDVEILEWDERFTTTIATQALLEGDVSRSRRKGHVDKIAATLLLQSYLDSKNGETAKIVPPEVLPQARGERRKGGKRRGRAYD